MTDITINYCYAHSTRESTLRCKRCERYMCASCAVRTPTGYLCKDCVRQHQKTFDTAIWYDYLVGFGVTFTLSFIASGITAIAATFIGFFMFFIAAGLGGAAGALIANLALRAIKRRRSKPLFITCAAGVVIGGLPIAFSLLFSGSFFALIGLAIYMVVAVPTVYTRVSGIQL